MRTIFIVLLAVVLHDLNAEILLKKHTELGDIMCAALTSPSIHPINSLFDPAGYPTVALLSLLRETGMEIPVGECPSIEKVNTWAQKNFLRQGERWDEQTTRFEALKSTISPLLTTLKFTSEHNPSLTKYQGALVHGALLSRVEKRFAHMIAQWNAGVRFTNLYFVSGERPLEEIEITAIRSRSFEETMPETESEMTQWVWEHTATVPSEMRSQVKVYFTSAPMKFNDKTNRFDRPTTDDAIICWLCSHPVAGNYLAASDAPYILRQDLVVRCIVPEEYRVETIGPAVNPEIKMAIILDEVARTIFQAKKLFDAGKL